ncbi:MAG TPA: hypothetical protein VD713_05120, partial [Sphingomonadales bacterium]|nr:hypothetical protein [Sphingomonadales bacterium]
MAGSPLKTAKRRLKGWFWFLLGGFVLGTSLSLYFSWLPKNWSYERQYSEYLFLEPQNLNLEDPAQTIDALQIYETRQGDRLRALPLEVIAKGRLVFETRNAQKIGAI